MQAAYITHSHPIKLRLKYKHLTKSPTPPIFYTFFSRVYNKNSTMTIRWTSSFTFPSLFLYQLIALTFSHSSDCLWLMSVTVGLLFFHDNVWCTLNCVWYVYRAPSNSNQKLLTVIVITGLSGLIHPLTHHIIKSCHNHLTTKESYRHCSFNKKSEKTEINNQ